MGKMNSFDRAYRDRNDLEKLLAMLPKALAYPTSSQRETLQAEFDAMVARRAAEDAGQTV